MFLAHLRIWGCNFSPETEAPFKTNLHCLQGREDEVTGSFLWWRREEDGEIVSKPEENSQTCTAPLAGQIQRGGTWKEVE